MAFVAQSKGMEHMGPFTFNDLRAFIAGFVLAIIIIFRKIFTKNDETIIKTPKKTIISGGIICGVLLFFGTTIQQVGLVSTTAGKGGFITALYIIFVPIFGLFIKKKAPYYVYISVVISLLGLYLLCFKDDFSVNIGDVFVLISAVFYSFHILAIDYFSDKIDAMLLTCMQFMVVGLIGIGPMFIMETPVVQHVIDGILPLLYAAVMSSADGFTLQIAGQKYTNPTVASLLMSMESVFAALFGWLILSEVLNAREFIGCVFIFGAVVLAQLPNRKVR